MDVRRWLRERGRHGAPPRDSGYVLLLAPGAAALWCNLLLGLACLASSASAIAIAMRAPVRAAIAASIGPQIPPRSPGFFTVAIAVILVQFGAIAALLFQRRRRLRSLLESEERMALAALSTNMGLWRWEHASDRIWATDHFRKVVGLEGVEPLTRSRLRGCIHPEDQATFDRIFDAARPGEQALDTDFRVVTPDGGLRWITGKARVHGDGRTTATRVSGVLIDVTERKREEAESHIQRQQLAHLTRVAILGELSGALAHELNQPLTSILSNAQAALHLLERRNLDIREVHAALQDIVADDKRAGEVIRRLRALLQRGETQLQRVSVEQVVRDVLLLAHSDLILRNIEVSTDLEANLPAVRGDRIQFQQVLLNLLLNACEAMSASEAGRRRALIGAARESDRSCVCISVRDQGRGIPPEELERVFDPFFTTKATGLGLGLAICRSIVSAHGGRLWASNNPDGGATFHFTVPIFEEAELGERLPGASGES